MSARIPLSRGMFALVDEADAERVLTQGRWFAQPHRRTFYARRNLRRPDGSRGVLGMHTLLTGWPLVDHVNGDGLDNRRVNLRQATNAQNCANKPMHRNNVSGFKGVSPHGSGWRATITAAGRRISLGTYADPRSAARAYDAAALHYFGEFARPNFPQEIPA